MALLAAIALPTIASATPISKKTIGIDSYKGGYVYQDSLSVGSASCYAWADTYADSRVSQVKAYAYGNGVTAVTDTGRYWAEATDYSVQLTKAKALSEAYIDLGMIATQHTVTLLNDTIWYGHYQ